MIIRPLVLCHEKAGWKATRTSYNPRIGVDWDEADDLRRRGWKIEPIILVEKPGVPKQEDLGV